MPLAQALFWGLAAIFLAGSLLPYARRSAWWIRIFDFPRLQLAVVGAGLAAALCSMDEVPFRLRATGAGLMLLGVALHMRRIVPYTGLWPAQVQAGKFEAGPGLRLFIANVLMPNRRADLLLQAIRRHRPDLIFCVETDRWWCEQLGHLAQEFPYCLEHPLPNTYGMAIRSRIPFDEAEIEFLMEEDVPSAHLLLTLPGAGQVRLHCLHPAPPNVNHDTAERDAELVLVARRVRREGGPAIVAGDLNDVAWSFTSRLFLRESGMLDPRIGRGLYSTYPVGLPPFRFPLDHVFHSRHFVLGHFRRLSSIGSDHFPILIDLVIDPAADQARTPRPDAAEQREADEMIREGTRK